MKKIALSICCLLNFLYLFHWLALLIGRFEFSNFHCWPNFKSRWKNLFSINIIAIALFFDTTTAQYFCVWTVFMKLFMVKKIRISPVILINKVSRNGSKNIRFFKHWKNCIWVRLLIEEANKCILMIVELWSIWQGNSTHTPPSNPFFRLKGL